MKIQQVMATVNQMKADGVIERYAIGGAVGATFYLEPVATLDVDIFVAVESRPGQLLLSLSLIFEYLTARGCQVEGKYILIAGWSVQFLPPAGALVEEALRQAMQIDVDGMPVAVFSAEHLAVIALQTGRAKDKARLLNFVESGVLDNSRFQTIIAQHQLTTAWRKCEQQFLMD